MATTSPITQQVCSSVPRVWEAPTDFTVSGIEDCLIYNRHGSSITFKSLFQNHRAIIVFVRNFLCYTCKEYVEDLSKVPKEMLQDAAVRLVVIGQSCYSHIEAFCLLTGYQHEIYVDPERQIYKKLGFCRGETYTETAWQSQHVKSSTLVGSIKSMWHAMTSPAFDFQGDPLQQGGALIIDPGSIVHFVHFDMNRFNHTPINWLLLLAGMKEVSFSKHARIINI